MNLIHDSTGSAHCNVNIQNIYVNDCGEWVLGGFESLSSQSDWPKLQSSSGSLSSFSGSLISRYDIPESVLPAGSLKRRNDRRLILDTWQFAVATFEIFNGQFCLSPASDCTRPGKVPTPIWSNLRRLLDIKTVNAASLSKFITLTPAFAENELFDITDALPTLRIAEDNVIDHVMGLINDAEPRFPKEYRHNSITPVLTELFESGKGGIPLLSLIIRLSKDMNTEKYKTTVSPLIIKQFMSNNRSVRQALLQSIGDYIEYLDKRLVNDKVYPSLATGFSDTDPSIRELSVRSVFSIAPKLNDRILNGDLLRQLAKVQNDSQKEIRANTTILLGKIAPLFSQSTRLAVLVVAFGRALKDPFVQSRLAALRALDACFEYFGVNDICNKILGTIAPALVDGSREVRDEALATFDKYFAKVKDHANNLGENQPPPQTESSSSPSSDVDSTAATGGWSNWASSLTVSVANKAVSAAGAAISSNNSNGTSSPTSTSPSPAPSRTITPSIFDAKPNKSAAAKPAVITRQKLATAYRPSQPEEENSGTNYWDNTEEDQEDSWGVFEGSDDGGGDQDDSWAEKPATEQAGASFLGGSEPNTLNRPGVVHMPSATTKKPQPQSQPHSGLRLSGTKSHGVAEAAKANTFAQTFGASALQKSANASRAHSAFVKKHQQEEEQEVEDAWGDAWDD